MTNLVDELRDLVQPVVFGGSHCRVDLADGAAGCLIHLLGDLSDFRRCVGRRLRGPTFVAHRLLDCVLCVLDVDGGGVGTLQLLETLLCRGHRALCVVALPVGALLPGRGRVGALVAVGEHRLVFAQS